MKYRARLFLSIALIFFQQGYIRQAPAQMPSMAAAADAVTRLRADLDDLFADPQLIQAQTCAKIFSLDREQVLYEKNPKRLFIPASTNKIVTAAVALKRLGPEYRFETRILTDGKVENGTLMGNLIIVGSGDPSLSPNVNSGDPLAAFKSWASKFKEKGIHSIAGSILGDDTAFKEPGLGIGWEWNDLPHAYAARAGSLQFNDNSVTLQISPGSKTGEPSSIHASPLENYLAIENRAVTGPEKAPAEIQIEYGDSDELLRVSGTVPEKRGPVLQTVAVRQPTLFYLSAFKNALSAEEIGSDKIGLTKKDSYDSPDYSLIFSYASPPLPEIIKPLLKNSQNLYAETLVRTLGLALRGEGSFAKGKEVIEETLGQMGIATGSYSFADASGLSRLNLESADSFVHLLQSIRQDPNFQIFYDALPVAGIDGTLSARMKGTKAANNVHAKTGSMTNVSSIAGYVKTAEGEMLAFSIAVNNFLAPRGVAESIQDKALEKLAGFTRR